MSEILTIVGHVEGVDVPEYETVQADTKFAAINVLSSTSKAEVVETLRDRRSEVVAIMQRLAASAGIMLVEGVVGERNADSPEARCLKQLKEDFDRGIVLLDGKTGQITDLAYYQNLRETNPTAGQSWEILEKRLLAKNAKLLKRVAAMQGGGQLIGVYSDGVLAFRDRGTEPVIYITNRDRYDTAKKSKFVAITTDTPGREDVLEQVRKREGQFELYHLASPAEIKQAVSESGYRLAIADSVWDRPWKEVDTTYVHPFPDPKDRPIRLKRGLIAASEAVTGEPYVKSANGKDPRSSLVDAARNWLTRTLQVDFNPEENTTTFSNTNDSFLEHNVHYRSTELGAVRWLVQ